jgi:hypothetical protein
MHQHRLIGGAALALAVTLTGPACGSIGGDGNQPGAADGGGNDGGPAAASTCETRSGTRLQEVLRQGADGSREHLHFQDTELETACGFAPAADGSIRCLPRPGGGFRTADPIYTDSECSDRIAEVYKDQPSGDRIQLHSTSGCSGVGDTYHQMGAAADVTAGQQTWLLSPYAGCIPYREADLTHFEYRAIGQELFLSEFVEASETMIGEGRLRVPRYDGVDGSSECRAGRPLRDQDQDGAACQEAIAEDGVRRCLPIGSGPLTDGVFTDAACEGSIDAGLLDRTCDPDATVIREFVDAACGSVQRVRAMGEPLGQLYWTNPGECSPTPDGFDFFRIGPAVAPESFAELSATETAVGDRLLRLDLTAEGGLRVPSGLWRDPTTGADCRFEVAADGATRCLPTPTREAPQGMLSSVSSLTYSDADCTMPMPVVTLSQPTTCGGAAPTYAVASIGVVDDTIEGTIYQLGDLVTDPVYRMAGTCALYQPGVDLYAVGAEVPPGSFVLAVE